MTVQDFSFAEHAGTFDRHITDSIPGYRRLHEKCVGLSRWFIQDGTSVVDIGCSTGTLLSAVREANQTARPNVRYIGMDNQPGFRPKWQRKRATNLDFLIADARSYEGYGNLSLALCSFTLQFIAERDKLGLLQKVYDGLVPGGALLIAEKVLASSARFESAFTFLYYDSKLQRFSADQVFEKQRRLRGYMTPHSEDELRGMLREVGFGEIDTAWKDSPFTLLTAVKL